MTTEVTIDSAAVERSALQDRLTDLIVHFFRQIHTSPSSAFLDLTLTMPQLKTLHLVDWLGPLPMSQVADRLGVSDSAATGLIDRLVDQGLARREHDPRDRRVVRVESTEAARALVLRLQSASSERVDRVLDHLLPADLERCARVLEIMNAAAEREAALNHAPVAVRETAAAGEAV